jgi:hypothetical protein
VVDQVEIDELGELLGLRRAHLRVGRGRRFGGLALGLGAVVAVFVARRSLVLRSLSLLRLGVDLLLNLLVPLLLAALGLALARTAALTLLGAEAGAGRVLVTAAFVGRALGGGPTAGSRDRQAERA